MAAWSWSKQALRASVSEAHPVVSKARRAASTARAMSAGEPSATGPRTSSVAGLTLSKVAPLSASTNLPSMSIRLSPTADLLSFLVVARLPDQREVGDLAQAWGVVEFDAFGDPVFGDSGVPLLEDHP